MRNEAHEINLYNQGWNECKGFTLPCYEACKFMIEITGGSKHWNGETEAALKLMESAVAKWEKEVG